MGFLQKIEFKKKIQMRWYIRAAIGLVGIAHFGLGIWVAIQAAAEGEAVSPISTALSKLGEKGYNEMNSQAIAAFMPFIVGIFCIVFALFQYYIMFYVLFILVLLELVFFIWSLIAVFVINSNQQAHYDLVEEEGKEMIKKAKEKQQENQGGGGFIDAVFVDPIKKVANVFGAGALVDKAVGMVKNFNVAGFKLGDIMEFGDAVFGMLKNVIPVDKFVEDVTGKIPLVKEIFGSDLKKAVEIINEKPELIKYYAKLKEVLDFGKVVAGTGLGITAATLIFVAGLIFLHKPGGKLADPATAQDPSQKSDVSSKNPTNQSKKSFFSSKSSKNAASPAAPSPMNNYPPPPVNNYPPPPNNNNNFGAQPGNPQFNPYV